MRNSILLTTFLSLPISLVNGQQAADGQIVPFTSVLPSCASQCGKLWDVQGACVPPQTSSVDQNCFCTDTRLTPFLQGTAEVESVCTAASCTSQADLQAIENWYKSYCGKSAATTTSSGSAATGTSSGSGSTGKGAPKQQNQTWLGTHWKWVVMLVVMVVGITGIWLTACLLRRRYIRKKEKEIEMRPPVAWGPHQMQATTGGYRYGDGVVEAKGARHDAGGHHKEASSRIEAVATPADGRKAKRESKGWLTKSRK